MRTRAKAPTPVRTGGPPWVYTRTGSMPQLGESFFSTKPTNCSCSRAATRARQALHGKGVVDAALRCNEARRSDITFESDGFAGDTETQLDLGAYRHPLDERSEQVRQEDVALMAAVESNFLPQQTGADADPQSHEHSLYWWLLPVARPGASSSTDRRRWPHAFEALACRYAASVRSRIARWSTMGAG